MQNTLTTDVTRAKSTSERTNRTVIENLSPDKHSYPYKGNDRFEHMTKPWRDKLLRS